MNKSTFFDSIRSIREDMLSSVYATDAIIGRATMIALANGEVSETAIRTQVSKELEATTLPEVRERISSVLQKFDKGLWRKSLKGF